MIKKETLHPKNNVQDDIYPKTSTDQVEGLSDVLALKANASDTYTKQQVDSALALKQDKLIAGEGISIAEDGKTISANGGKIYKHYIEVDVYDGVATVYFITVYFSNNESIDTFAKLFQNNTIINYSIINTSSGLGIVIQVLASMLVISVGGSTKMINSSNVTHVSDIVTEI